MIEHNKFPYSPSRSSTEFTENLKDFNSPHPPTIEDVAPDNNKKEYKYMSIDELTILYKETCAAALDIVESKNHDYTGNSKDIFKNFRGCERRGIPAELGLLIRCDDKFDRLDTFIKTGTLKVADESVDDTIKDIINYMIILKGIITERKNNDPNIRKKEL